jgi:hypothetical protein
MYHYDSRSGKRFYIDRDADHRTGCLFGLLQEAITERGSGTLLSSLDVLFRRHYYDDLGKIAGLYTGMCELCFDIDAMTVRDRGTSFLFEQLLRAAPNLELLAFAAGHISKSAIAISTLDLVSNIFDILTTCRLHAFSLQVVACTLESLQKLMKRHKQTLTRIKFVRVTLLGSWRDCLSWMRKKLDLTNFHIEQVRILDLNRMASRSSYTPRVLKLTTTSFKGKENTRIGLDGLLQILA